MVIEIEHEISGKPKSTITKTVLTPKARIFTLKENEVNEDYETLLKKISDESMELVSSSGVWHEGIYRIQVHYIEIKEEEVKREDTDFEGIESKELELKPGEVLEEKAKEEKSEEEKSEEDIKDNEIKEVNQCFNALEFEDTVTNKDTVTHKESKHRKKKQPA